MESLRNAVLVVEDEQAISAVISEVLAEEGYVVHSALHGEDALEQLATRELPSLIVLDLNMPVMDGRDFLDRRVDDPRLAEIPVLVISADARAAARVARDHGIEYLVKPFKLHQLLAAVSRHCMPETGVHATVQASQAASHTAQVISIDKARVS